MRLLIALTIVACASSAAYAQEQSTKPLLERIPFILKHIHHG
jgi:hypothetical protein